MRWVFGLISIWLLFVLSLTGWWLYFGITTLSQAAASSVPRELTRHQRMLFTEGTVLMASLLFGGLALFYFAYRMYQEKSAKELFFASFAHDLKTSLFRLQLEVEKHNQKNPAEGFDSVLTHTRKMQLDLENGLDSIVGKNKALFWEKVDLKNSLAELHAQWPEFTVKFSGEVSELFIDRKALNSILKNLLHNSFVHGQADQVFIGLCEKSNYYALNFRDNGLPFKGDLLNLGLQSSGAESGFGLMIVRRWVRQLHGQIEFLAPNNQGLQINIQIPKRLK